jgi:hypothetical protein
MAEIEKQGGDCFVYNWRDPDGKAASATSSPPLDKTFTAPVLPVITQSPSAPLGAAPTTTDPSGAATAQRDAAEVIVSARSGVVRFVAAPGMYTPEGIGIGSNIKTLVEYYPKADFSGKPGPVTVPVPENPGAYYVFELDSGGRVVAFSLESKSAMLCPPKG